MNEDAVLYSKHCESQKNDAKYFLETYSKFLKFNPNARILEIGTADGTISLEILLPKIPRNFTELVLSDVSDRMITCAKEKIRDERISCMKMDITTSSIPEEFKGRFDHIFSFYCLHCVDEKRTPQALQNIFKMLKPGGSVFLTVISTSLLYSVYRKMKNDGKWPSAMDMFGNVVSLYHDVKNPAEKFRFFLENAGFDVQICSIEKLDYTYSNFDDYLGFALSIIVPFFKLIDENEKKTFVEDFEKEIRKSSDILIQNDRMGNEKVTKFYKALIACVIKPFSSV